MKQQQQQHKEIIKKHDRCELKQVLLLLLPLLTINTAHKLWKMQNVATTVTMRMKFIFIHILIGK